MGESRQCSGTRFGRVSAARSGVNRSFEGVNWGEVQEYTHCQVRKHCAAPVQGPFLAPPEGPASALTSNDVPESRNLHRIGVFGGTFDPPHVGHLVTAVNVRHELALDVVLLVVAGAPWQKEGTRSITPAADRLAMVEAAVAG